ncbi:MAG: nucleotide exchange factor GrpE [Bacilli bacterium]|nr:nucleotide exchange factor GrpE [Bacilli bacterium]
MSKKHKEDVELNKDHECNCENCNCDEECDCNEECDCGKKDGQERLALEKYIKELEDKVLREKAESINYRKRKDDEVSSMLKYANEDLIRELLPIADNFERAIKLDNNDLTDEVSKFLEGFKMMYSAIINIFNKYEVKAIDGSSKPFDPTYHQAVLTEKVDGVESGMVIEVLQKGYLYKDRVLRPAMVKVSE